MSMGPSRRTLSVSATGRSRRTNKTGAAHRACSLERGARDVVAATDVWGGAVAVQAHFSTQASWGIVSVHFVCPLLPQKRGAEPAVQGAALTSTRPPHAKIPMATWLIPAFVDAVSILYCWPPLGLCRTTIIHSVTKGRAKAYRWRVIPNPPNLVRRPV